MSKCAPKSVSILFLFFSTFIFKFLQVSLAVALPVAASIGVARKRLAVKEAEVTLLCSDVCAQEAMALVHDITKE